MASWVPGVNPMSQFSLANIPLGIISTPDDPEPHVATAIGSLALDLKVLSTHPDFTKVFPCLEGYEYVFSLPALNEFAALGREVHREVRETLQGLLAADAIHPEFLKNNQEFHEKALIPLTMVELHLPMYIGDYTDFYAGYHHAYSVGAMFRGEDQALQPNYLHMPVGYHGRASSVVVTKTPIKRPWGQIILDHNSDPPQPMTWPSRRLDFELELGCLIATPNARGESIKVNDADDHIFGYVLLNDWSARDIQTWEYVPLGPFCSKNFATTISGWVVLADAMEPFRTPALENPVRLQGYLRESREDNVFDIELEVDLISRFFPCNYRPVSLPSHCRWVSFPRVITTCMRCLQSMLKPMKPKAPEGAPTTITRVNSRNLLWSFPQMIAHHTLGGCPLRTGDLLGSGTISGPGEGEKGSLLEMSEGGTRDVLLFGMEVRKYLKDGDTVTFRGVCGGPGARVGFGDCTGRIFSSDR